MILRNNFRIKSKIRFTIFIALMLIFTTMLCNAFMSLDFASPIEPDSLTLSKTAILFTATGWAMFRTM